MDWYLKVLKNYVGFDGRARRTEFWMFFLFNLIAYVIAMILDWILGLTIFPGMPGAISMLYSLAVLLPNLAVGVRRLHDIGQSGWLILVGIIPLIGVIVLLILFVLEGKPGENQYGPNPKEV